MVESHADKLLDVMVILLSAYVILSRLPHLD